MKKTVTTGKVVALYNLLKAASLKGMETLGKFAVIKTARVFKDIAEDFESFREDAIERLKDDQFNTMQEKARKWNEEGDSSALSDEEKVAINAYFHYYRTLVDDCLKEETKKECSLVFQGLNEAQFEALIAANDNWNVEQIMLLEDTIKSDK